MTSDTIAKIHQVLSKELAGQKVEPNSRSEAYKLVCNDAGKSTLFILLAHAETVLSEVQLDALKERNYLLDDGRPARISWGTKKQYAIALDWNKLQEGAKAASAGRARVMLLERRVKTLEAELKDAKDTSAESAAWVHLLDTVAKTYRHSKPKVPALPRAKRRASSDVREGVASLVLSDWHWGETVDEKSVNGLNAYNVAIAERRANRIFDTALELLAPEEGKYDALVVPILGDMLSGIIHDELVLTNDGTLIECILSLVARLEAGLFEMAQHFPLVQVTCVFGNHGRMDKRKTHKRQAGLNWETLVYRLLEQHLRARMGDRCNVSFKIATSSDQTNQVYDKKFLFTHGDQFDIYQGGAFDKVRAGDFAKRKRAMESGNQQMVHDYLVCGHFHQYGSFGSIIMNGSLVGYNEYAFNHNLSIERPQQALFVNHPQYGIIKHMPVFADEPVALAKLLAPVSVETR